MAPDYPDKRFVIYDSDIDYSAADLTNVYSTTFKQNEASFLAGALGARMTSLEGDDHVNPEKVIGFVAGGDNVIINDFFWVILRGVNMVIQMPVCLFPISETFPMQLKARKWVYLR